ncbi:hypothetical protein ACLOJK_003926 [Asimina triloba]
MNNEEKEKISSVFDASKLDDLYIFLNITQNPDCFLSRLYPSLMFFQKPNLLLHWN